MSKIPIAVFLKEVKKLAKSRNVNAGMVENVGRNDPFKILVSCILSLRTKDELSEIKSRELFRRATTPHEFVSIGERQLAHLIYPVGFYRRKAKQLIEISKILISEYSGKVPDNMEALLKLPGVGRKTANLVLIAGFDKPGICVDTHVHRITNRWGYVKTVTPEQTEMELRKKLPAIYWKDINYLLVFFGKTVCLPVLPRCSTCPLKRFCPAINVVKSR